MATAGGAAALNLPVGRFAPECCFDAVLVDTRRHDSNLMVWQDDDSLEDVLQKIIYNAGRDDIRKVWVNGRLVTDKGRFGANGPVDAGHAKAPGQRLRS